MIGSSPSGTTARRAAALHWARSPQCPDQTNNFSISVEENNEFHPGSVDDHDDSFVGKINPFCQAAVYPRPSKAHQGERVSPLPPTQWSRATDAL